MRHRDDPTPAGPLRAAAVDVGTNAMRFLAAEITAPQRWTTLDSARMPVRVGHRVFQTGRIPDETLDAAAEALRAFRGRMDRLKIQRYRAVATSAVRESENAAALLARAEAAGIRLEVIDGEEEARLGWLAIRTRVPMGARCWLAADLGGGSLEISLMDDAGVRWTHSRELGSVRLLEARPPGGWDTLERLRAYVEEQLPDLGLPAETRPPAGLVALGGSAETLAELAGARTDHAGVRVLRREELEEQARRLAGLSVEQRVERLGLRPDRADVILPAAAIYARIAELAGSDALHVPGVGVKQGLLLDVARGAGAEAGS